MQPRGQSRVPGANHGASIEHHHKQHHFRVEYAQEEDAKGSVHGAEQYKVENVQQGHLVGGQHTGDDHRPEVVHPGQFILQGNGLLVQKSET